jgi:two-component system, NarL family, response regulator DegU
VNNILIIYPFQILRKGLSCYIQNHYKTATVFEFDTLEDCDTTLIKQNDILIIYIQTTSVTLLNTLKRLQKKDIKIVIWMESSDDQQISFLFRQGFLGYFLKEVEEHELLKGLESVLKNTPYLHSKLSSLVFKEYLSEINKEKKEKLLTMGSRLNHPTLTNREWDVLNCLSKGYSNGKIAKELFLTESTVKNHVSSILKKLKVSDRTAAVVLAIKNEWIKYASII